MEANVRAARLVAVPAMFSGVISTVVVAVPGGGALVGGGFAPNQATIYGPGHAALAVILALAGVALHPAAAKRPQWVVALIGVVGLCSSQLAGVGLVGYRRWPLYWGCCSMTSITHQGLVRVLALVMAVVCALTVLACLVALGSGGLLRWQGWAAAIAFPVAVVVSVAIPRIMGGDWSDKRELVAAALTYSLPLGVALALSALMVRRGALVVAVAVAGSALIAGVGRPFLETVLPVSDARAFAVGAAVIVILSRQVPQRAPVLDQA